MVTTPHPAAAGDDTLGPDHFWAGPRREWLRSLLARKLPRGSTVADAAWRPGSPLEALGVRFRSFGLAPGPLPVPPPPAFPVARARLPLLPVGDVSLDGVLLVDILERLDEDRAAIAEARRVLRPGGLVVIVAAAQPRLWSAHDSLAGNRRRYTLAGLLSTVAALDLVAEEACHLHFLLFPLFAVSRWRARRGPGPLALERHPPAWVNRLLARVNRAEASVTRRVPWPWGSSVLVCARRL